MKYIKYKRGLNMKKLIKNFSLIITVIIVFIVFSGNLSAQQRYMNYQGFYDQLSPYGQWVENPDYGYVWIPNEGPDFTPYLSNGYWVLTDYGWMWVSNYNWGWATFHYGRWDYNDYYGWYWVPDNEWGPSWVTWRRSEGYYGWAPMRPGISINISFGSRNNEPSNRWVFVRDRDFERHDIDRNYVDRSNNITIINNSTVINKTYYDSKRRTTYITGPGRQDVEKVTGRTLRPIMVREKDKPGETLNKDQVHIYRPEVQKNKDGKRLTPTKVTDVKDVKRISERNTQKQSQNKQILNDKPVNDQRPVVNPVDKNNSKVDARQKQNTDLPNRNINKEKQPVVNQADKNNSKVDARQKRNTNPPNRNINKEKQPVVNQADKNNSKVDTRKKQNTNSTNKNIIKEKRPVLNPADKNNSKVDKNQSTKKNPPDNNDKDQTKSNSKDGKNEK
jgi:hypothetical protein